MGAGEHENRSGSRGIGRPRSPQVDAAILEAGFDQLAAVGFDRLTMEAVAERAGVSKATLYLRWSTKEDLVVAVVDRFVSEIAIPDSGTVEGDLVHMMEDAVRVYGGRPGAVIPGLLSALAYNKRLAETFRGRFLGPRRTALRTVIDRAVRRGEFPESVDRELALDFLGGPLFYRLLLTGGPLDQRLARDVVSVMLYGLSTRGAPRP